MNLCLLVLQARTQILKVNADPECQNLNWCLDSVQRVKRWISYANETYKGHISSLPTTGEARIWAQHWIHFYVDAV